MTSRRSFRIAIAVGLAAVASFAGVQPASAVSGSITGHTTPVTVTFEGGASANAALMTLTTGDGDTLFTYCIDFNTHTGMGVGYDEGSWDQANVPDVAKVTAKLQASYPVRSVAQDGAASGIASLTEQDAITATQAAIWHFTDVVNLDRNVVAQDAASNVGRLYDYLLEVAAHPAVEPETTLSITPASASGTVGTRVGPFTLNVTPSNATVTVSNDAGAAFTDGEGNLFVPSSDGQVFWLTPAHEGSFSVTATAEISVPTGRVFLHPTSPGQPDAKQKLVLAKSGAATTTATASVEATPVVTTTTEATTTTTEATTTTAAVATTEAPTTTAAVATTEAPTTTAEVASQAPTTVAPTTTGEIASSPPAPAVPAHLQPPLPPLRVNCRRRVRPR